MGNYKWNDDSEKKINSPKQRYKNTVRPGIPRHWPRGFCEAVIRTGVAGAAEPTFGAVLLGTCYQHSVGRATHALVSVVASLDENRVPLMVCS